MNEYAHPQVLVSTQWVEDHINDTDIRIIDSNDLQDALSRDYIDKKQFEKLMSEKGIANDTTVVFYGDNNNWWTCYAF